MGTDSTPRLLKSRIEQEKHVEHRSVIFRRISIGLAILGILIAGYLTWIHYSRSAIYCVGGSAGCDIVQQSRYSNIGGVPVALIGLVGYLAILGIFLLEEIRGPLSESGPLLVFAFSLIGTLYSAYLTYLELFVIGAICQYCVTSAIIMILIFASSVYRLSIRKEPEQASTA